MITLFSRHIRSTFFIFILTSVLFSPAFAVTWDGDGGDGLWSTASNWSGDAVPASTADITIDCGCTVTSSAALQIDGSLTIASGTTLDLGANNITIGQNDVNDATLTNNGTITTTGKVTVKGNGLVGAGPFIVNSGTINTDKMSVGNNNGGGKLTNLGTMNTTGDWHVDGTVDNQSLINAPTGNVLFHGAILTGGGTLVATAIELADNNGKGASGGASDIQSQSFVSAVDCAGEANEPSLLYTVSGGTDPDDTYTYQELLDEFGTTDPEFTVDPNLVTSCGITAHALPIELLFFIAKANEQSEVKLVWATASETDNDYFVIERSQNGIDWEELFQESGAGNSATVLNYSMIDKNPYKGISYYQLKQVDFDGAYSYSPVISILVKYESDININPNPIINQFTIIGESIEDSEIAMTNMMGQEVHITITKALSKAFVQTKSLDKGVYLVTINRNGIIEIKKLLVV